MASVSFDRITKIYPNGYCAIRNLDLDIRQGELMVIVGPSGCGKSTLLRILAGLEDISAGTLRIGGHIANGLTPQQRNIAMVFQDYALYPAMTVRGNLEFPLRMRKLGKAELKRRVDWAADLLDLGAVMDRLPKQLSGGQRQRVAMGRALVREPSVFLLDEPLSNLDARLRAQVRAEIGEVQQRTGATMVYVTHDQVEAMTLGQRIAVLDRGHIQQVADPKTLYDRPANPFVAGFIGSPPMNLFRAELRKDKGIGRLIVNGQVVAELPAVDAQFVADAPNGFSVTAGIRPEALHLAGPSETGFNACVLNAEYLGHETLLHVQLAGAGALPPAENAWIVRLPGMHHGSRGETVRLAVEAGQVYLFR
jgi:multiple sugar transport system ATP-binding protein